MQAVLAHIAGVPVEELAVAGFAAVVVWLPFVRSRLPGAVRLRRRSS